jgi:hypothetical protein
VHGWALGGGRWRWLALSGGDCLRSQTVGWWSVVTWLVAYGGWLVLHGESYGRTKTLAGGAETLAGEADHVQSNRSKAKAGEGFKSCSFAAMYMIILRVVLSFVFYVYFSFIFTF